MKSSKPNRPLIVILSVCCLLAGWLFVKMNPGEYFNGIFFGIGLLGIVMSVLRESSKK